MTSQKANKFANVALLGVKGGVGKTTLAVHLAVAADAHLIDVDPQGSAAAWGGVRGDDRTPDVYVIPPNDGPAFLREAAKAQKSVIIDTPGVLRADVGKLLRHVDFILAPVKASALDLWALGQTRNQAEQSGRPFAAILSDVPTRGAEVDETDEILRNDGWRVAPVRIHHRVAYSRALASGNAVNEVGRSGRSSADEIAALWRWILDEVAR
jgi:chromosome partitioning protein